MPVAVKEPEIAPLSAPVSASAAAAAQADEQPSNGAAGGVIRKGVASPASSGSKPPSGGAGGSSSSIKQHKQGVKSKRAATTVYLVLGVCAVIVALALAGRRAAQVGGCLFGLRVACFLGLRVLRCCPAASAFIVCCSSRKLPPQDRP